MDRRRWVQAWCFRCVCFPVMSWLRVFVLVFTSPRRTSTLLCLARVRAGFPDADLFAKRTRFDGALPASSFNVDLHHKDLCAKPASNDGASSTLPMIQPRGVDKESSIASAVTGLRPEAEVPERRASDDGSCPVVPSRRARRSASLSSGSSQISDASYADTDASMSESASSDARPTPSSNGSDVTMTDIEEIVSPAGQMGSEPLSNFQMQAMFPVWEA